MKKSHTYKKILGGIIFVLLLLGGSRAIFGGDTVEDTFRLTMVPVKTNFHTALDMSNKVYTDVRIWYKKNNSMITILPDIVRVPMIDFLAVLLGIFLGFFIVFRYLSR